MTRPVRDKWLDQGNSPRSSQVPKRPKFNVVRVKDGKGKELKPIKTCRVCFYQHQKGWPDCAA